MQEIYSALLASLHSALSEDQASARLIELIHEKLGYDPMAHLMTLPPVRIHPHLKATTSNELSAMVLKEELLKHSAIIGAEQELAEAEQDLDDLANEGLTWRIQQATQARDKATKAEIKASANSSENRENLSQHLQKMLDDQIWVKKKK
jgi:DNA primase